MSIASEINRIQAARNAIRDKMVELGLGTSVDDLTTLAEKIATMANVGGVSYTVVEGQTVTIPKGYHNGTGTVTGVAGGGDYDLESKTVTPTKSEQSITPSPGKYGLSDVLIKAIPDAYQNVSTVNATAADVLKGKIIVDAKGTQIIGTMPVNVSEEFIISIANPSKTISKGYHDGEGVVKISPQSKTVTPTKAKQTIVPEAGKVLSEVVMEAIPSEYQDVTPVTATADKVLEGSTFVDVDGAEVAGTMKNRGAYNYIVDIIYPSFNIPAGYHNGEGEVRIEIDGKIQVNNPIVPKKTGQTFTPEGGKVFGAFTIAPIPDAYQDVTGVTATAAEVLDNKFIVTSDGNKVEGTMPNNGATGRLIDGISLTSYTIPAGYTTGGIVQLDNTIENELAAI